MGMDADAATRTWEELYITARGLPEGAPLHVSPLEVPTLAKNFNDMVLAPIMDNVGIEYYIRKGVMKILGHPVQVEP